MTLRSIVAVAISVWATIIALPANAADAVGVRTMTATAPERGQSLEITLWYPADASGTSVLVGDNKVFEGVPARRDAPIADGAFPIVLVAHGGMRAAPHLSGWIASNLAKRGFVVAATRPPGLGKQGARAAVAEIWLRPADLSATLTMLDRAPALAGHVDPDRVGALGFLLGGTSVLALAGARPDAERYAQSCDQGGTGLDCAWFAQNGIDLRRIDTARLTRSNLDRRIEAAVVVDPELSGSFTPESLSGIAAPVEIINLGRPDTIRPGLNASSLKTAIPAACYVTVSDATQFDSFSRCKPRGSEILSAEGDDDAIRREREGRNRESIHLQLTEIIAEAFERSLQGNP